MLFDFKHRKLFLSQNISDCFVSRPRLCHIILKIQPEHSEEVLGRMKI